MRAHVKVELPKTLTLTTRPVWGEFFKGIVARALAENPGFKVDETADISLYIRKEDDSFWGVQGTVAQVALEIRGSSLFKNKQFDMFARALNFQAAQILREAHAEHPAPMIRAGSYMETAYSEFGRPTHIDVYLEMIEA